MRPRLVRLLGLLGCSWTVRCDECAHPGRRGAHREVAQLAQLHNSVMHRGHPVASARLALVTR